MGLTNSREREDKVNRETIREKTMQLIYQMDASGVFDVSKLSLIEEDAAVLNKKQAQLTLDAVRAHLTEIDALITANLENWSFERLAKTDLAIIRTAVAEMLYIEKIPYAVSINEAVRLSKIYSDDNSYKFVNSVLGKIAKSLEQA